MKRFWMLLALCLLCGCTKTEVENELPRMVYTDGTLYADSGRVSENTPRCGVMDGEITTQVEQNEIPTHEGEANFDADFGYQLGRTPNTIELNLDGEWRIFYNVSKPPEMRVLHGEESFPSMRGGFSWTGIAKNGKSQTVIADALHTLECKDLIPILTLRPTQYSSVQPNLLYLEFDLPPDHITARCWTPADWGNPSAEADPVTVTDSTIPASENGIYEITAQWDLEHGFGGEVTYAFCTRAPKLCGYPTKE